MSIKNFGRAIGLGSLIHHGWRRPSSWLKHSWSVGGPWEQYRTERGRREMERAAHRLTCPAPAPGAPLNIHLLTGRRFWYQTAFCLHSLATHAACPVHPIIYDDGTLHRSDRDALLRLFPSTRFVAMAETLERLNALLPTDRFPLLRDRWQLYPNIRKLIDPHLGSRGWKLVLDSDLLFFRRPNCLLDWAVEPNEPFHAVDCTESYGYSRPLMERLTGGAIPKLVNVGLCGLRSEDLDWDQCESWCRQLIAQEGQSYYLEQALVAMLVTHKRCTIAPAADYVTLPRPPEALKCAAVMHHYVAESKRWYFQTNWRRSLPRYPTF